jgi:uncharacterized membrane protein HdeD (DUF308 family)
MNTLLKDWHLMRVLRLVAGLLIIYMAFTENQLILSIMGFLLLAQAVFNTGCGANGCNTTPSGRRYKRRS